MTTTLTGHAGDWGDVTVSAVVDWAHLLAASIWTGGLMGLTLAMPAIRPQWSAALLASVVRRFSAVAGVCLLLIAISGAYTTWRQLGPFSTLWTTLYGRVLLLKLLLVLALVSLGAANRYGVLPHLDRASRAPSLGARFVQRVRLRLHRPSRIANLDRSVRLSRNIEREALIGLAVFGCTALLGEFTPARHAGHTRPAVHDDVQRSLHQMPSAGLDDSSDIPSRREATRGHETNVPRWTSTSIRK